MKPVKIKVKYFAMLASEVGNSEMDVVLSSDDLTYALKELEERTGFPLVSFLEAGKMSLLINGRAPKIAFEKKYLADNDVLAFIPIMGGG